MTIIREKHSVIRRFSFGCQGNGFHVKSDKIPPFNPEKKRQKLILNFHPLLYQELFIKSYECKNYLRYSLNADACNMCIIGSCEHYHTREMSGECQNVKMGNFQGFFACFKETCKISSSSIEEYLYI